jgi:phosphate transport system substrate-binding protein
MMKPNSKLFKVVIFLQIMICLSACNSNPSVNQGKNDKGEWEGAISISGAFALYPLTAKWAEEFQKINPKVRIDISAGGAGKGMADALSGMVDLGVFSRGITDAEKAQGCWWLAVTKDAVLPTINAENPWIDQIRKTGISHEQFEKIFITGEIVKWKELFKDGEDKQINIYTRSDACGAAQMWGEYLGKDQESLIGVGVFGDPGMADAVKNDIYSLGFNNVIYVYDLKTRKCYDKMDVIPIDLNSDGMINTDEDFYSTIDDVTFATKSGRYPSPPARDLYFVSKGKPANPVVIEFLKWILTDGQQYVEEAGYVNLAEEKINQELTKLAP